MNLLQPKVGYASQMAKSDVGVYPAKYCATPFDAPSSSRARPRVLLITHRTPYPPDKGDRIRTYNLLRFLAGIADVDLVALSDEEVTQAAGAALGRLTQRLEFVANDRLRRWFRACSSLCLGRSATEGLFASRQLRRLVRNWIHSERYDLIVAICSSMAQYLPSRCDNRAKTVLDLVDVDSQKWIDYAKDSRGLKKRLYQLEAKRVRAVEAALPERCDRITLTTSAELECYREFCSADVAMVMPNGVDFHHFYPNSHVVPTRDSCVFVGALDYKPNVDAVTWFCDEVWTHVVAERPGATFTIVGRRPVDAVRVLARRSGVAVVADVADVRPYLWSAAVAVAPLRIARGVQNKVLEAMASGTPSLISAQALMGLGAQDGREVIVANSADEFLAKLTILFDDAPKRRRLAERARDYVLRCHSWSCCLGPLRDLLETVDELPAA